MPKNSQINIRFDDATDEQLDQTAKNLGISKSALVRHLTKTFLDEVQKTGSVKLKPDWTKMLDAADGRSSWGERKVTPDQMIDDPPSSSVKYSTKRASRKKDD